MFLYFTEKMEKNTVNNLDYSYYPQLVKKNTFIFFHNGKRTIFPNCINFIDLDLQFEMKSHLILKLIYPTNKCWKILNEYFIPDIITKTIKLPIITNKIYVFYHQEPLCQMKLISVSNTYENITG